MVTERTLVMVQSGGEILVLSTGSSKMSINICSGNVGYKQATYQHNLQYVSLDNASHNVVTCWFDLLNFCFKNRISNPNSWGNINDHAACIACSQALHHQAGMF
jgi:hypothetical protein